MPTRRFSCTRLVPCRRCAPEARKQPAPALSTVLAPVDSPRYMSREAQEGRRTVISADMWSAQTTRQSDKVSTRHLAYSRHQTQAPPCIGGSLLPWRVARLLLMPWQYAGLPSSVERRPIGHTPWAMEPERHPTHSHRRQDHDHGYTETRAAHCQRLGAGSAVGVCVRVRGAGLAGVPDVCGRGAGTAAHCRPDGEGVVHGRGRDGRAAGVRAASDNPFHAVSGRAPRHHRVGILGQATLPTLDVDAAPSGQASAARTGWAACGASPWHHLSTVGASD
jgi:hypothetical protein